MSESNDTLAADLEPLMLEMGKAIFICQAFESSLCFLHAQMSHEESSGEAGAFEASWDFHSSKTLGQTLNALRKRIDIPDDLNDYLEEGLKTRNLTVHGYITRNLPRIMRPEGRLAVESELSQLKLEVKKRDIVVNKLLDALFEKYGFSNEDLKRDAGEMYAAMNTPNAGSEHKQ